MHINPRKLKVYCSIKYHGIPEINKQFHKIVNPDQCAVRSQTLFLKTIFSLLIILISGLGTEIIMSN